jgi:hypothetical protein
MEVEWCGCGGLLHHESRDAGTLEAISKLVWHYMRFEVLARYIVTDVSEEPAASMFTVVESTQGHRPGPSVSYIWITFFRSSA